MPGAHAERGRAEPLDAWRYHAGWAWWPSPPSATLESPEKGGGPKLSDSYSGTLEVSGR